MILLTGMSGVGKSSIVGELRKRGFSALDMDEPGWSSMDASGHQRWNQARLQTALDTANAAKPTSHWFVAGCAEDQVHFYPHCSHIVLLSAPWEVMIERIAARTNNPYGKTPAELQAIHQNLIEIEPLLRARATHEISTVEPLDVVVAKILHLVGD